MKQLFYILPLCFLISFISPYSETGKQKVKTQELKALAKLFVVHDHINPEFKPDYSNYDQRKYNNFFELGSPSGVGFSFYDYDVWDTASRVGARLVSESSQAAEYIAENPEFLELYKTFMVYDRQVK